MECPTDKPFFLENLHLIHFSIFLFLFPIIQTSAFQADTAKIRQIIDPVLLLNDNEQWEKARSAAHAALPLIQSDDLYSKEKLSLLHNVIGDAALELGAIDEAKSHYDLSLDILTKAGDTMSLSVAAVLNKLGNYHLACKDYETALIRLDRALDIRRQAGEDNDLETSHIYNNLGVAYLNLGDFDQARNYQEQALRIRSQVLSEPNEFLAQTYQNLAQCYQDGGQIGEAIRAYEEALDLYLALGYKSGIELADVYLNLGTAYYDLANEEALGQAIRHFRRALDLYDGRRKVAKSAIALTYNNLANSFLQLGKADQAFDYYQLAVSLRKEQFGEIHPDVAQSLFNIGQFYYLFLEQNELAIGYFDQCLHALNYDKTNDQAITHVNSYPTLLLTLYYRAGAQFAMYRKSASSDWLHQAGEGFAQIDQLLDFLRVRFEGLGSKYNLVANGHQMYDDAINVSLEQRRVTGEEKYFHHALKFSEKSKGLILFDALQKSKAESFGDVPAKTLAEVTQLEVAVAEMEKELFLHLEDENTDPNLLDSLGELIFKNRQLFENKIQEISIAYPRYFNMRYAQHIPSVAQLQHELLEENETLVEYFMGDTVLHIFVINQDEQDVVSVGLTLDFLEQMDTFNFSIRGFRSVSSQEIDANIAAYIRSATMLYQYLIAPIKDLLREHLIIVPDGKLGFVAFEALLTDPVEALDGFNSHPYLLRQHSISYNYSASLLAEMSGEGKRKGQNSYLGFAPSFASDNQHGLSPLLFNKEEVTVAASSLGGRVFVNGEATKSNFLKHQQDYQIIHLATHGKVNVRQQDYSFLAFTEPPGSEHEDGLLYVREIYNVPIRANLVILSACETGDGRLLEGEGIASIARGFSYAGAESLLATRWPINDKTTSVIVRQLLHHLEMGMTKDQALRFSTLEYIDSQSRNYAHPFYWSSFMLLGDMQPMKLKHGIPVTLQISLCLILLAVLIYFGHRRRNRPNVT